MTVKSEQPDSNYFEEIPMPWGLRYVFYGAAVAMVVGLVMPIFFPDEDITGRIVWVYYPSMLAGFIALLMAAIWFRKLIVWVDDTYFAFGYGRFRKRFTFDQIESVEATPYSTVKYGGSGIRYARGGYRAWSVPFLRTGVEVKLNEGGKERTYYVSSRRADQLADFIQARLSK